jgi:hypothetical protein
VTEHPETAVVPARIGDRHCPIGYHLGRTERQFLIENPERIVEMSDTLNFKR